MPNASGQDSIRNSGKGLPAAKCLPSQPLATVDLRASVSCLTAWGDSTDNGVRTFASQPRSSAPSSVRVKDVGCAASRSRPDASHESLASAGGVPLARRARRAHHHHAARADGHGRRRRHHGGTGQRDRPRGNRPRRQSVLAADAVDVRDRDGRDALGLATARRRTHRRRRRRGAPGAMDRGVRRRDGCRAAAVRGTRVSTARRG